MLVSVFDKVTGLACNFFKKRLQHGCFPVKFVKFLGTVFFQNTSGGCFRTVYHYRSEALS